MRNKVLSCSGTLKRKKSENIASKEEQELFPSDYCRVVTTINSYSTIIVDSTKWKCVHSLQNDACSSNVDLFAPHKCNLVHYGLCSPITSKEVVTVHPSHAIDCQQPIHEKIETHSSDPESDSDNKTATKSTKKRSTKSPAKPSSPTLSDCAAIQLLAEDVEGKLESLLQTFVREEKLRQEAKLNLLNKRSSSSTSLSSDSSSLSSSPTITSNGQNFFPNSSGNVRQSGRDSLVKQRSMSPSRQNSGTATAKRRTSSVSPSRQRSASPSTQEALSSASSLSSTTVKQNGDCAKNTDEIVASIKKCDAKPEKKCSANSSQSSTKISSNQDNCESKRNKMVFGLHEKTPKSKYMQIVNERQSGVSSQTPSKTNPASHSSASDPSTVATVNSPERSSRVSPSTRIDKKNCVSVDTRRKELNGPKHDECHQTMEQILREALQLTDDEKTSLSRQQLANDMNEKSETLSQSSEGSEKQSDETTKNDDYNFASPVDYAKSRFITISKVNKNAVKEPIDKQPKQSLVNEARIKWENGNISNVSSSKKLRSNYFHNFFSDRERPEMPLNGCLDNTLQQLHRLSPITPFLTKGSVAERVLLFEKRPEIRRENDSDSGRGTKRFTKSPALYSTWRTNDNNENEVTNIARNFGGRKHSLTRCLGIPRFYYPNGCPLTSAQIEAQIRTIKAEFAKLDDGVARKADFRRLVKACGLPLYWKCPLYLAALGNEKTNVVTCEAFVEFWKQLIIASFDLSSKFVKILSKGRRNYLIPDDFVPMLQDVIDTHPGLKFLIDAVEFHSRYINTVIARIFYCVNQSWNLKITVPELRKSNFLAVLSLLEEEDDINQITDFFSYEHFYVIYCKFWELDKDHDLVINKYDLSRHNDGAISSRMINRIFSGAVTRGPKQSKMTYSEFVWFLLSEEDKKHPRSIEYWFRCMDIDGDGYLSMFELEYFYEEQIRRMEAIGIEPLPFNDCLCQMLDMIKPKIDCKISLADLKNCKLSSVFFDTFFNLDKYLDFEQRDPFACKDQDDAQISDWDRFAAEEYEILVAEENAHNHAVQRNADDKRKKLNRQVSTFLLASKKYGLKSPAVDIDDDEDDYAESDIEYAF